MSVVLTRSRRDKHRSRRSVLLETSLQSNTEVMPPRQQPNILITGTPGTGKTTHAELVAAEAELKQLNIGELVREHELHDGFDDEFEAYTMNDDKVNDHLEEQMERGGFVVDHHSSDFFPERFFDLVVVLQTDNTLLYDRLQKRGYAERKIQENVQCEIMHVPCEEARRSYKQDIVQVLSSNDTDEMEQNVARIVEWCRRWRAGRPAAS